MSHIIVAHAPEEEARASLVAEKLGALGFEVRQDDIAYRALSPFERRKLLADIDKAACVLVLWSRDAAVAPALRAMAERAKAKGKLALARLDASAAPARAANLAHWQGMDEARGWRQVVAAVNAVARPAGRKRAAPVAAPAPRAQAAAAPAPAVAEKKSGGGLGAALAVLALLAAAGGGAYYYFFMM